MNAIWQKIVAEAKAANDWIKAHPLMVAIAIAALIIGVIIGARG